MQSNQIHTKFAPKLHSRCRKTRPNITDGVAAGENPLVPATDFSGLLHGGPWFGNTPAGARAWWHRFLPVGPVAWSAHESTRCDQHQGKESDQPLDVKSQRGRCPRSERLLVHRHYPGIWVKTRHSSEQHKLPVPLLGFSSWLSLDGSCWPIPYDSLAPWRWGLHGPAPCAQETCHLRSPTWALSSARAFFGPWTRSMKMG